MRSKFRQKMLVGVLRSGAEGRVPMSSPNVEKPRQVPEFKGTNRRAEKNNSVHSYTYFIFPPFVHIKNYLIERGGGSGMV